ncbi:HIRAN domain-containing protein [uncultured Thiodictyon sp.]|uniref:HIRAN domain-containing protein n=1 Tax=uncultured Thiodictyon sp. TaxID=1846217 RepID=UPI0025F06653|nr:HIRAN domain-containing protein [uncultured Thiodictyon sp.]
MKALFVAVQDHDSRCWAPVARLTRENGSYRFVYTEGARDLPGFTPFGRMTNLESQYISNELFPLFANRVLPKSRPEYRDYLNWLGLSAADHDALDELARTGGLRATDTIELIPYPEATADRCYVVYFFGRGLRHLAAENQARIGSLDVGERLHLLHDLQNPIDCMALMLRTGDPVSIVGYVPRYYAADWTRLIQLAGAEAVMVTVERVNQDAPMQYRLLCKLSAPWPAAFSPCKDGQYRPISTPTSPAPH